MAILKVAQMGHPCLRDSNEKITTEILQSEGFQLLIDDMIETMVDYDGIGLAAPQVHINLQLLVMLNFTEVPEVTEKNREGESSETPLVLINPSVEILDNEKEGMWEGCLSIPDIKGYVERPRKIEITALDRAGKPIQMVLEGLTAIIFQHELDHLQGSLFIDKIAEPELLAFSEEYNRYHQPAKENSVETAESQ